MTNRLSRLAAAAGLALLAAVPAFADAPRLKASVSLSAPLVQLGDLVENAGHAAAKPVFRAPDPGHTGAVPVAAVLAAAERLGLEGVDTAGLEEIVVSRKARIVSAEEIETRLRDAILSRLGLADEGALSLVIDQSLRDLVLDPEAEARLALDRLDMVGSSGRFRAAFSIADAGAIGRFELDGTAYETVEIVVPARPIRRGEIVGRGDLLVEKVRRRAALADALTAPGEAIGMAARRGLQVGAPLAQADLVEPELVARGDMVTLVFRGPGLNLSVRARARQAGARGDLVTVVNLQSNRMLQGIVTGPGRVELESSSPALAAHAAAAGRS